MNLIVNPSSTLHLLVHCRVRGRGPVEVTVPLGEALTPDEARALIALASGGAGARVPPGMLRASVLEAMVDAGVFVEPAHAATALPTYACTLDTALPALLPAAARERALAPLPATVERASEITLETDAARDDAPSAVLEGAAAALASERPILWVRDPGPGTVMPFALAEPLRDAVLGWLAGERPASALPGDSARLLRVAGVLGRPGFEAARAAAWQAQLGAAREQLAAEGFAVVREVFNPVQIAAVRTYMRALHAAAAFTVCDECVELRDWIHNEEVARFLHHQLAPTVNALVPSAVKPSYAYLAMYHPRAELKRHVDRPQCQWNVSMPLDTDPETDRATAWPIYVETNGRAREVRLGMGDMVLYRGTEAPHWREPQPEGHRCTVCFFHFVAQDFAGPLD